MYYMDLIDEHTDSDETLLNIADQLKEDFKGCKDYVIIVGDGKTYDRLMKLKKLYGKTMEKILIFPGDWHTLKNYQPVLMKAYFHCGLKELSQVAGFKGENITSLFNCSHFKRTHHFLLQAWEALYLEMLRAYNRDEALSTLSDKVAIHDEDSPEDVLCRIEKIIEDGKISDDFLIFVDTQSENDRTWQLWKQFVLTDCMAYVLLYLGIRSSNWQLRMAGLKLMSPLFSAFDRSFYSKIIPHHFAEIQTFPKHIMLSLESGGFTVSICGRSGQSVAFDEAHEMMINKEMKAALTRTSSAYLQKMVHYLRYRIKAHHNFLHQLYPSGQRTEETTLYDWSSVGKVYNNNITAIRKTIREKSLLPHSNRERGLLNVFSGVKASEVQTTNLLRAREIGMEEYTKYITYHILRKSSTDQAPMRKQRLLTLEPTTTTGKKKHSMKEKEQKRIEKCLRRRLTWCNQSGNCYEAGFEQYSIYPRAMADSEGKPHKGCKSKWTEALLKRYPELVTYIPPGPYEAIVVDISILLHVTPTKGQTIASYSKMIMQRYIMPHCDDDTIEIHLVFDRQCESGFNPKQLEQERRDSASKSPSHTHLEDLRPNSETKHPWQEYINCHVCKQSISEAVGLSYLQTGKACLKCNQKLVIGGCFGSTSAPDSAWEVCKDSLFPQPKPEYNSTADEADSRIWRHIKGSALKTILVYSTDTDVYNIGLSFHDLLQEKDVTVKINPINKPEKLINLPCLLRCIGNDPDLASLPSDKKGHILQSLYITSGCDYISFFSGHGKTSFLTTFCQHAKFINDSTSLSHTSTAEQTSGFLGLVKLLGVIYFKKHHSAFFVHHNCETPEQLFDRIQIVDEKQKHLKWIEIIREVVSERVLAEEERVPSTTALERHWKRTSWISLFWNNSTKKHIDQDLPSPQQSGWHKESENSYSIDWDCEELQEKVRGTIEFLTKGCTCKKTKCLSSRCSCRANNRLCGPACKCANCENKEIEIAESVEHNEIHCVYQGETDEASDLDEDVIEEEIVDMDII